MKELKDILYKVRLEEVLGDTSSKVGRVAFDSRKVKEGDVFVAIPGTKMDGHDHIPQALEGGAKAVVVERLPKDPSEEIVWVKVRNAREALAYMASNFYGQPSEKMKVVGVTGTNGKTTIVTLLHELFLKLGYPAGMLSTVVNKIGEEAIETRLTTPDPLTIQSLLAEMVDAGCEYCFMEVSSHALVQHRVTGIDYACAVFTNITHEHLDYHKDFNEYLTAKKLLFDDLSKDAYALVNADDRRSEVMVQNTPARVRTFGLKTPSDIKGKLVETSFSGIQLNIDGNDVWSSLIGSFNASNLLAVYGVADLFVDDTIAILRAISSLQVVSGRFEYFRTDNGITGVVDFAHSPDALENVLKTIKEIRTGNEQLITVVGCGGDRDKEKRPEMARLATEFSDRVVLTSDNPRTEDPMTIIEDMKKGLEPTAMKKVITIPDRKEAIRTASSLAEEGDMILVAGKGHEKYQEVNGERLPFDDMKELKENLKTIHN